MRTTMITVTALALPTAALAHPGHGAGFGAGFGHPFTGLDHVLAMLAVGLWAAQAGGRALWAAPLAFVGAMLIGGVLGEAGVGMPAVEQTILASGIVLGLGVALAVRPPMALSLGAIALFGLAHGHAHGAEMHGGGFAAYAVGFALATALLNALGVVTGRSLWHAQGVTRMLGGLTAAAGAALAIAG